MSKGSQRKRRATRRNPGGAPNSSQAGTVTRARNAVTADEVTEIVQETITAEFRQWSGPLPHPDDLARFNEVVPGSAHLIVKAFVDQGDHRRSLEQKVVGGSETRAARGQFLVYTFLMVVVIGGIVVALHESGFAGATIITAGLGSGVALYVLGGRKPHDE